MSQEQKPTETHVTEEMIRKRAYHIWESKGRPRGRDLEHWLEAQAIELAERAKEAAKHAAGEMVAEKAAAESPSKGTAAKKRRAQVGAKRTRKKS